MPPATARKLAIDGGRPVFDTPVAFMKPGLKPQDVDAAHEVLKSGMLRSAKKCEELEERFARASGARHGLTCANGTCALQMAYGVLFERGDEVLVPAWTYIATVSMIVAAGLKPVWVDALEDTMQIDVQDAAKKVTSKTRGIAATHLYGMPVDIKAVQDLAKASNLKVVYDCAQSHLATYHGDGIGKFGNACTYSFYATKNLGTGEGGMITVNDDGLKRDIALMRSHGETDKYLHERIGFNYRMNDITGAIGCSRLDRLLEETCARREAADQYDTMIEDYEGGIKGISAPGRTKGADAAWHLYTAKMDPAQFTCDRDTFVRALNAEGVPTAIHYPRSLTHQPAFKDYVTDHPPVAEGLASKVFCLPMHHELDGPTVMKIGEAIAKVAATYRR